MIVDSENSSKKQHKKKQDEDILMGTIRGAYGLKGAVRIKSFTQKPEDITRYGPLHDRNGRLYQVRLLPFPPKPDGSGYEIRVMMEGVTTPEEADALRGTELYVKRADLPDLGGDEFYHYDLVGLQVCDQQGRSIGHVDAVAEAGKHSVLHIMTAKNMLITLVFSSDHVGKVDLDRGVMEVILPPELAELFEN